MTSFRRTKWKIFAVFAGALAVGVAAACLLLGKMRERRAFVSKITAGYRYRCTLSANWVLAEHSSEASVENSLFTPSPSPIREWIATHLP